MKRLLFVLLTIITTFSFAQDIEWLVQGGGELSDKGTTIVLDDQGNSYITGYYNEEADFGPFNTGFSFTKSKEVFVAKLDPNGNYLWVSHGLNYYDDRGLGLCLDPSGNVYVTGTCWGGLDWGSLSVYNSTAYTDQIFVVKLDNNGNEIWMKNAGVDQTGFLYSDDHGHDIISDSQGNIFVTGHIGNNDYGPQNAHFGTIDIPMNSGDTLGFVAKMNSDGDWLWVETFGGVYYYRDNAIGMDDDDNVYVTGGFKGTRNFGPNTITSVDNSLDIYVVKYDNNGNFQFVVQVGDSLSDRGDGITYGNDGHMYVTGEFRGEVYFGTDDLNNYGSPEDKDIFVAKMTKDGQWKWATKAGNKSGGDRGIGICANNNGNIFVAGQFKKDAQFGPIFAPAATDSAQAFIAAIDTAGIFRWVMSGSGADDARAAAIACDDDCNIYATGFFRPDFTMDSLSLNAYGTLGKGDIFVAKIAEGCFGYSPDEIPGNEPPEEEYYTGEMMPVNVFSPNDDGVNDLLFFTEAENVKGSIVITNRWGNVVYETKSLVLPWDGTNKAGEPVKDGTYFYVLEWYSGPNEVNKRHGFITVVR